MTTFTEKYHPQTWKDVIWPNEAIEATLRQWAFFGRRDPLLMWGPPGVGKSSLAEIICRAHAKVGPKKGLDLELIRCDVDTGVQELRKAEARAPLVPLQSNYRYWILDEVDRLTDRAQDVARGLINRFHPISFFVLTTNYLHSVDDALKSRCQIVHMPALHPDVLKPKGLKIMKAELGYEDKTIVGNAALAASGDVRKFYQDLSTKIFALRQSHGPQPAQTGAFTSQLTVDQSGHIGLKAAE